MSYEIQRVKGAVDLSIAASGTGTSGALNVSHAQRCKWVITTSGANCTATPQMSLDGVTWFAAGAAYALAATGPQANIDLPGPFVRLSVANAGAGTQALTAELLVEVLS